jgi:hypothetical protein
MLSQGSAYEFVVLPAGTQFNVSVIDMTGFRVVSGNVSAPIIGLGSLVFYIGLDAMGLPTITTL